MEQKIKSSKGAVVFAWGEYEKSSVFNPNADLAKEYIARAKFWILNDQAYPVFTQDDIYVYLVPNYHGIDINYLKNSHSKKSRGEPPSTYLIAQAAAKWIKERDIQEVHIYAARPHIRRCVRDMKKAARDIKYKVSVTGVSDRELKNYKWYRQESLQNHVRSRIKWWRREIWLRLLPWSLYKRITS